MRIFISKTYPIKGVPVYRAYHTGSIVTRMGHDTDIRVLVEMLESTITPKPEIIFDDDARLDFWRSL